MEGAARRGTEGERKFEQPACAARTACGRRCGAAARGAGAATLFTSVHSGVRGHQGLLQMRHDAGSPSCPSPGWIGAAGASSTRRMAFHCVLVRNRQRPYTLSPKKRRPLVSCLARCALSPIPFPIQSRINNPRPGDDGFDALLSRKGNRRLADGRKKNKKWLKKVIA